MSTVVPLYPLVFDPIAKPTVWGGRLLAERFGKPFSRRENVGESWEIVDRPEASSRVANGPLAGRSLSELVRERPEAMLGRVVGRGRFPLLVKLIHAREALSIQVHPPAEKAAGLGGESKTEIWRILEASPGAVLHAGFRGATDRAAFEAAVREGRAAAMIHQVPVEAGDVMFLQSGRVHALGAGLVILEVQENSDTTYRVYDWNRLGTDGKPRALHLKEAMACANFDDIQPGLVTAEWARSGTGRTEVRLLADNPVFRITEHRALGGCGGVVALAPSDVPLVLVGLGGALVVHSKGGRVRLNAGRTMLVPPGLRGVSLRAGAGARWWVAIPS